MINKKVASELAVGMVLIVSLVFGGIFLIQNKKDARENVPAEKVVVKSEKTILKSEKTSGDNATACTMEAMLCADGTYVSRTGPNCEFTPCPQSQIKTGFKLIEVNNPSLKFSFEVPEGWASEIRNAGIMNEEDFKIFASNERYLDLTSEIVAKSTPEELEKYKLQLANLPNASVSSNMIQYSDWNAAQVDFSVILKKDTANLLESQKTFKEDTLKTLGSDSSLKDKIKQAIPVVINDEVIAGFNAKVLSGGMNSDGYISSGSYYVLDIPNSEYSLTISKQALGNEQFEQDFSNIIRTLKISAL